MAKEQLMYSEYLIRGKRKSNILEDTMIYDKGLDYFICPRCKNHMPPLPHGKMLSCDKCHLWIVRWGNMLEITD